MLNFGFVNPKRHILVRSCVFWRILRQNLCGHLGCRWSEEPPTKKIAELTSAATGCEIAHAQKWNSLSDLDKILHGGRYPRLITYPNFGDDQLRGLGDQILPIYIGFRRRPYNTLTLVCECVTMLAKYVRLNFTECGKQQPFHRSTCVSWHL